MSTPHGSCEELNESQQREDLGALQAPHAAHLPEPFKLETSDLKPQVRVRRTAPRFQTNTAQERHNRSSGGTNPFF